MTTQPNLNEIRDTLIRIAAAIELNTTELTNSRALTPTVEQSATVLDYLVLRQLVGRKADEIQRVVSATRKRGKTIEFFDPIPEDVALVAVFTKRGQPTEVVDVGGNIEVAAASGGHTTAVVLTVKLSIPDTEPITRIELRRADGLAIALGPRLAAVA